MVVEVASTEMGVGITDTTEMGVTMDTDTIIVIMDTTTDKTPFKVQRIYLFTLPGFVIHP